jgi:hypothetical protein
MRESAQGAPKGAAARAAHQLLEKSNHSAAISLPMSMAGEAFGDDLKARENAVKFPNRVTLPLANDLVTAVRP